MSAFVRKWWNHINERIDGYVKKHNGSNGTPKNFGWIVSSTHQLRMPLLRAFKQPMCKVITAKLSEGAEAPKGNAKGLCTKSVQDCSLESLRWKAKCLFSLAYSVTSICNLINEKMRWPKVVCSLRPFWCKDRRIFCFLQSKGPDIAHVWHFETFSSRRWKHLYTSVT